MILLGGIDWTQSGVDGRENRIGVEPPRPLRTRGASPNQAQELPWLKTVDTQGFISYITGLPAYRGQLVHWEDVPSRVPRYGDLERPLPLALQAALEAHGLLPLFSHQAWAINALGQGENVVLSTPAASGKSLCYHIPILEACLLDKQARALYVSPTKALAQDQRHSLTALAQALPRPLAIATYDGDTPVAERAQVRRTAQVVLTNPDMLHLGLLPNHAAWARLLRGAVTTVTSVTTGGGSGRRL